MRRESGKAALANARASKRPHLLECSGEDRVTGGAAGVQGDGNVKRRVIVFDGAAVHLNICEPGRGRALLQERDCPGLDVNADETELGKQVRERQQ